MIAECLTFSGSRRNSDRTIEHPAVPIDGKSLTRWFGDGASAASGVKVTKDSAMGLPAIWRGVNLLSGDVGKLPCHVYRRRDGGGKDRDTSHPSYYRIRREPNSGQSAFQFRRSITGHAILGGNGYAYIYRTGGGAVDEMYLLDPATTFPVYEKTGDGTRFLYVTTIGNQQRKLLPENVLHIKGFSWDGLCGESLIDRCKDALGLPLAQQRASGKFFANGSKAGGVLMFPGHINRDAQEELLRDFESKAEGLENMHKTILLEDGVKYQQLTVSPENAQLVESAQFSNRQIALLLGVPVSKLGDTETNAYASLEEMNQSYLDEGLDLWLCNWEDELWRKCLTEEQKRSDTHVIEFVRAALVRANIEKRYTAYRTGREWGWLSADDVRDMENLNPVDQEGGKDYHMPVNYQKLGAASQQPVEPAPDPSDPQRSQQHVSLSLARKCLVEAIEGTRHRMLRRLANAARKTSKKPAAFPGWLDAGVVDDHGSTVHEAMASLVRTLAIMDGDDAEETIRTAVGSVFDAFRSRLLPIASDFTPETLPQQVDEALKGLFEEAA